MKGLPRSTRRGPPLLQKLLKPRYVIRAQQVTVTDPGSANAPFTAVLGDFPEGNLLFLGGIMNAQLTAVSGGITATFTGNIALGSAPTADATLNGSEVDIIASTAITTAVSSVSAYKRYANATAVMLDNTDGSLELNLNGFIADAAISANGVLSVDAMIELALVPLLDD